MRRHPPLIKQRLHSCEGARPKCAVFSRGLTRILTPELDFAAPNSHDVKPRWLDRVRSTFRDGVAEWLDGDVSSASTADRAVAQLCCLDLGDAVERRVKLVVRIPTDLIGAIRVVIVEDLLCAKARGELEVGGRGGGDGAEAGTAQANQL